MTHKIFFITKDRAQICHGVHTTTDDVVLQMIVAHGERLGYEVRVESEE